MEEFYRNRIAKAVISIKVNISSNYYESNILRTEIEKLCIIEKSYIKKLESSVVKEEYKSHCFCCNEIIDSSKNDFCMKCGWYKCLKNSCGCNFNSMNYKYRDTLRNNSEAKRIKEKIEEIDLKKSTSHTRCKNIDNENAEYDKKLKKYIKEWSRNETFSTVRNKKNRI